MHVVLASASPLKIKALHHAMTTVFNIPCRLTAKETESGVSEQPHGFSEMVAGATTRMQPWLKEDCDLVVGIESGLVEVDSYAMDMAFVQVYDCVSRRTYCATTQGITVPTKYVHSDKTWGQMYCETTDASADPKNPHASLHPGTDRATFLTTTLVSLLREIKINTSD